MAKNYFGGGLPAEKMRDYLIFVFALYLGTHAVAIHLHFMFCPHPLLSGNKG